ENVLRMRNEIHSGRQRRRPSRKATLRATVLDQVNADRRAPGKRVKDPRLNVIGALPDHELLLRIEPPRPAALAQNSDPVVVDSGDDPSALVDLDDVAAP